MWPSGAESYDVSVWVASSWVRPSLALPAYPTLAAGEETLASRAMYVGTA